MNILQQFARSLYSSNFIAAIRFQKFGKTFRYILLLTSLSLIPIIIVAVQMWNSDIPKVLTTIQKEIPAFTVSNGELKMNELETFNVYNEYFFFSIDGKDEITENSLANYTFSIVFKEKELIISTGDSVNKVLYSTFNNITFNEKTVSSYIDTAQTMIPLLLFVFFIIFFIIQLLGKFLDVLILAAFAVLFAKSVQKRGTYMQFISLSAYALTISSLFFAIMNSINIDVVWGGYVYWGVNFVVMLLAINSMPKPKKMKGKTN